MCSPYKRRVTNSKNHKKPYPKGTTTKTFNFPSVMKIMHIAECAGGVDRYLEMLLPQLQDEYEQVFVCSFHFDKCKYEGLVNQVEQIEMRQTFSPLKIISQVKTIRKLIRKHHPDIVYCHSSFAGGLGRLACLGLRCKVVYNPHGWAFNMK